MAKSKVSPMMEHYLNMKEQYPDTIMMYRLGDFYEMFFDDAKKASAILDLTLTGRDCGLDERAPMCGVPYHAVDNYISRLINAGEKVAICEQLSNPADQIGMVKRDVIRVITPGTVTSDDMLNNKANNYLTAVIGKNDNYGVAWIDITTGELFCKEFYLVNIDNLCDYLMYLSPSEIISNRELSQKLNNNTAVISAKLPKVYSFYDYSFDVDNAKETIIKQFSIFSLDVFGINDKPLATQAVGGLLEYITSTQKRTLTHINKIQYVFEKQYMQLDYNTQRNLELVEPQNNNRSNATLLWILDRTKTSMGARKLRNWILNPLQSIEDISLRQAGVTELQKSATMRGLLANYLSKIKDIERLVGKISYGSVTPRDCLVLCDSLKQLPYLREVLIKAKSKILSDLCGSIDTLDNVALRLTQAIDEDCPILLKDGNYIKTGYNSDLDELRALHCNSTGLLKEFELKQRELTNIPKLKVAYNRVFGYYIEIPNSQKTSDLPFNYVRKQTIATAERYTSNDLQVLENAILGASDKIMELESNIYSELKTYLEQFIPQLQNDAKIVATLDCLNSLAEVAVANNFVCPKFNDKNELNIVNGRHPVVERLLKDNQFVPNDTTINKENSMLILTGPNMAGKSTYIRQVGIIVLMAHIGSYVPATKVDLSIVDRIFTRVGASDNLSQGQSTFMVEMLEVANILNNATSKSLLILDEIGRGTSTLDGLSIAWAIVEYILIKIKAKTLFATHYHELSELEYLLEGVRNYRILVQEFGGKISFLYKIARGGANKSFGIEVASLAGVNNAVIQRAKDIMNSLSATHELSGNLKDKLCENPSETSVVAGQTSIFEEDEAFTEIKKILSDTDINRCTPIEALTILGDLKQVLVKRSNVKN